MQVAGDLGSGYRTLSGIIWIRQASHTSHFVQEPGRFLKVRDEERDFWELCPMGRCRNAFLTIRDVSIHQEPGDPPHLEHICQSWPARRRLGLCTVKQWRENGSGNYKICCKNHNYVTWAVIAETSNQNGTIGRQRQNMLEENFNNPCDLTYFHKLPPIERYPMFNSLIEILMHRPCPHPP